VIKYQISIIAEGNLRFTTSPREIPEDNLKEFQERAEAEGQKLEAVILDEAMGGWEESESVFIEEARCHNFAWGTASIWGIVVSKIIAMRIELLDDGSDDE
jgi:hypothetical protein